MDIEIERRADVGVAQYDAHGLVVAVARTNFASEKIVHERQDNVNILFHQCGFTVS